MRVAFNDLRRQSTVLGDELGDAFADVVRRGRFVGGPAVASFERAWAAWCGAREAVGVSSGTAAIALALRALGVGRRHEVITAANTCVPTVAGIEAAGAIPVLVDVDETTGTLDPGEIEGVLSDRTAAVLPVHLYGGCADLDGIAAVARRHGLWVVEDAAQAHGAELAGRRTGTLGHAAAFSFYPTKNLGALGDAGAVVTNDPALAGRVRELRSFGERAGGAAQERGTNSRLDTLQAALLDAKLPYLDGWTERRRELANLYRQELDGLPLELPRELEGSRHVFHLFVVRVRGRDRVQAELAARGIETLVHYPLAVHQQPAYSALARPGRLERSERWCREALSLPLYPELTDEEARAVVAALHEVLGARSRAAARA